MADYIEREAAIAKLTALEIEKPGATMADARRVFADMPAADVVEVARCEDCAWNDAKKGKVSCHRYAALIESGAEDFCSFGKRREKDD